MFGRLQSLAANLTRDLREASTIIDATVASGTAVGCGGPPCSILTTNDLAISDIDKKNVIIYTNILITCQRENLWP